MEQAPQTAEQTPVDTRAGALALEDRLFGRGEHAPKEPPAPEEAAGDAEAAPSEQAAKEPAKVEAKKPEELLDAQKLQAIQTKERELRQRAEDIEAEVAKRVEALLPKRLHEEMERKGGLTLAGLRGTTQKAAALEKAGWSKAQIKTLAEELFYGEFPEGTIPQEAKGRLAHAQLEAEINALKAEREAEQQKRAAEEAKREEAKKAEEKQAAEKQIIDSYKGELRDYLGRLPAPLRALRASSARKPEWVTERLFDLALDYAGRGDQVPPVEKLAEELNALIAEGPEDSAEEQKQQNGATKRDGHQTPQGQAGKPPPTLTTARTAATTATKPPAQTKEQLRAKALEAEDRLLGRI